MLKQSFVYPTCIGSLPSQSWRRTKLPSSPVEWLIRAASVPAALRVKLADQATGAVRTSPSRPDGLYRFDLLPPGDYSVRVTATGFKTAEDSRIHLEVANPHRSKSALRRSCRRVGRGECRSVAASVAKGTVVSEEKVKAWRVLIAQQRAKRSVHCEIARVLDINSPQRRVRLIYESKNAGGSIRRHHRPQSCLTVS